MLPGVANAAPLPAPGGADLRGALRPFERPDVARSVAQLVVTGALFVGAWALAWWSLRVSYALTLLLCVPPALLTVRLFIVQHDCGHGSFWPKAWMNDLCGSVLGILTLAPYHYWRRTHAIHHAHANNLDWRGELGYLKTLTTDEYRALPSLRQRAYRLYRNRFFLLGFGVPFQWAIKHRLPWDVPAAWRVEWVSVAWTNLGLAGVLTLAHATIGIGDFLLVQAPITLVETAFGGWLFIVQHTFAGARYTRDAEWDFERTALEGSSWFDLPPLLAWFSGNIGLHQVHHLAARIPNYRLREALDAVPFLKTVPRISVTGGWDCGRYALFDEAAGRMVAFEDLR